MAESGGVLQLMKMDGSEPAAILVQEISDWTVTDEKWVNDSTLIFKQANYAYPEADSYARMRIRR